MKFFKNKNTLYCFSPPVMVATIVIELALAIYSFIRYKLSKIRTISILTLIVLAIFQLAEFNVCSGFLQNSVLWSRVGYATIMFLPALGLHGISVVAGRRNYVLISIVYAVSVALAAMVLLVPNIITVSVCSGHYVLLRLQSPYAELFYLYYNTVLVGSVVLAIWYMRLAAKQLKPVFGWYIAAYLSFMIPTALIYLLRPSTFNGIPSIMCGFAIIAALILALRILPLAQNGMKSSQE